MLFSRGIKNDKGPGREDRNWVKCPLSIEIFVWKYKKYNILNMLKNAFFAIFLRNNLTIFEKCSVPKKIRGNF